MFERFSDRARRAVVVCQNVARELKHNYIGTEHILIALGSEEVGGVSGQTLIALGATETNLREKLLEIVQPGENAPSGHIPFTPRAKKVLEYSLREALQLGHNYIGTEHILLGLIREGEGTGCRMLTELNIPLKAVKPVVIGILTGYSPGRADKTVGEVLDEIHEIPDGPPPTLAQVNRDRTVLQAIFTRWDEMSDPKPDLPDYLAGAVAALFEVRRTEEPTP